MYDFETPINRRNSGSLKWDVPEGELPMWVADMDFYAAPAIRKAIEDRSAHGVFGYTVVTDEWYDAYINWWKRRHHFEIQKDWLIFCTGVVPAISSIVRKLTTVAEKVLIQTPVYNIFFNSIINNGRYVEESPLIYENGEYSIDFEQLEKQLSDPQVRMMILCNPHNPVGKIWDRETLSRIGDLCVKHNVIVVSDEIHCDITDPDSEYIPFASVSENCRNNSVTCIAPTKAFNIAGINTAAVVVPNESLRLRVDRGLNTDEVAEPNVFAVPTAIAAFDHSEDWLDELRAHFAENKKIVYEFIEREISVLKTVRGKATYLIWIDCSGVCDDAEDFVNLVRKHTGLYVTAGGHYGDSGKKFLRMNIACPKSVLADGLERLKRGTELYIESKK